MLQEHLSQEHDLASRRSESIDLHVEWIFSQVLNARPAKVLDLACGPGLYTRRLAGKGCECVGIDFSPASIRHAATTAAAEGLACDYRHADLREGRFGTQFELVMLVYGQFNVFQRDRGLELLKEAHRALEPGGSLLLELQTEAQIRAGAQNAPTWYSAQSGLFSDVPHIVLQEHFWDDDSRASTLRFSVIAAQSGKVSTFALSNEAYSEREITDAVEEAGFTDARWFPSLSGEAVSADSDLPVVVARK